MQQDWHCPPVKGLNLLIACLRVATVAARPAAQENSLIEPRLRQKNLIHNPSL
jgi:hypothetical protein